MQSPQSAAVDPAALAAWQALLRTHATLTRAMERELLAAESLPLGEYDVLVQLQAAPDGRLRMAQLADLVLLSRSGLTRLVERMEAAGLVRREICPSDARGAFAVLTAKGAQRLARASATHLRSIQEHFAEPLDSEQLGRLQEVLERLLASSGEVDRGCRPEQQLEED